MNHRINTQNPANILIELSMKEARELELFLTWECDSEIVDQFLQLINKAIKNQVDYNEDTEMGMKRMMEAIEKEREDN